MGGVGRARCVEPAEALHIGVVGLHGAEEGVGKRDRGDVARLVILGQVGIDEEHDRHVDFPVRIELLLREAETLHLLEIESGRFRRHVEGRMPHDRLIAEVLGREVHELLLAQMHRHFALHRFEPPRQAGGHARVEPDLDGAAGDRRLVRVHALRRSAEARGGAEKPVQRRRIGDDAGHDAHDPEDRRDDQQVLASLGGHGRLLLTAVARR